MKKWPQGNSYLRLLSSLQQEPLKRMTIFTHSEQEQQLVSEAIQVFARRMKCIGVELQILMTSGKASGEKKFSLSVLKEMST